MNPSEPQRRIAIWINTLDEMWGVARFVVQLANAYVQEQGDAVQVDILASYGEKPRPDFLDSRVNLHIFNVRHPYTNVPSLLRYCMREKPDILLSVGVTVNVVTALLTPVLHLMGSKTQTVISEHVCFSQFVPTKPIWQRWLYHVMIKPTYRLAQHIVSVSDALGDDLAQFAWLRRERVHTVYNPLVSEEVLKQGEEAIDHPWFAESTPIILSAGRLIPLKRYDLLIRAFAAVHGSFPCRLVIVGEGEERPQLEALAKELGVSEHVSLPGFANNPFPYMKHAALFVLTSQFEGLPSVLVEAMAFGLPVIATDCVSGPDEILDHGRYGTLIPVDDEAALVNALRDYFTATDEQRHAMREKARERAQDFNYAAAVQAYEALCLANARGTGKPMAMRDEHPRDAA